MSKAEHKPCCCTGSSCETAVSTRDPADWVVGSVSTAGGAVPQIATALRLADHLGAWKMRWGIGRMRYCVAPGLYAVGTPHAQSPVLVSANYKLSFDKLRCELGGLDAWILVLDTKGVNVWCAAGKGTFGTDEIVRRVEAVRLGEIVTHRTLVVPQLGAPGVAAHEVQRQSGFRVAYGPVRAADIREFLCKDMQATPGMRRVRFALGDRIAVIPVELVHASKTMALLAICLFVTAGLGRDGFDLARMARDGSVAAGLMLAAFLSGIVFVPVLLPWLPGRALAAKGACFGAALVVGLAGCVTCFCTVRPDWFDIAAWGLATVAITSFVGMGFTGSTTYTSLSGVRREMRVAVPLQLLAAVAAALLWLSGRFIQLPPAW